jgi:hypothetical protein
MTRNFCRAVTALLSIARAAILIITTNTFTSIRQQQEKKSQLFLDARCRKSRMSFVVLMRAAERPFR